MKIEIKCPAADLVHPVLSRNPSDVQCRVQGGIRPTHVREANGAPTVAVCCSNYERCSIWRVHKDIIRPHVPSTKKMRDETLSEPQAHTLRHATRDKVGAR